MALPAGWEQFTNFGSTIRNTFLPLKVPLKEYMTRSLHPRQQFTTQDLMDRFPNLGMVVDLTQTANPSRYYNPLDLEENGIKHVKIIVRGGGFLPESSQIDEFIGIIDNFTRNNPGKLIGVHCTHGLNRTGYMICNYLIRKHGMSGRSALQVFEEARGHRMERQAYVDDILSHEIETREQRISQELERSSRTAPKNTRVLQHRSHRDRASGGQSHSSSHSSSSRHSSSLSSARRDRKPRHKRKWRRSSDHGRQTMGRK